MNHHDLPAPLAGRRFTKRDAEKALRDNDLTWHSAWCDIEAALVEALSCHYRNWSWERCCRRADVLTGRWIGGGPSIKCAYADEVTPAALAAARATIDAARGA